MSDLVQLPSTSVVSGATSSIALKDLPVQRRGRVPHVRRFVFEVDFTPTTTALPTTVGNNRVFQACDFWDGNILRFVGGFNEMRAHERYNTGRVRIPDADTDLASGSARFLRRVLHVGPPQGLGGLSDFLIPTGMLQTGELRIRQGILTDYAADCTAITGTVRTFADLEILDEVRIPPAYTVTQHTPGSTDFPLTGRCLVIGIAMFDSSAFGAFTNGDVDAVKLDLGYGEVVQSVPAEVLAAAYTDDFAGGQVDSFVGEPRGANDDNHKQVNHGTPTAIAAGPADLQPIVWYRPGGKLTKQEVAETGMRLSITGTQTTNQVMLMRCLPQPPNVLAKLGTAAMSALGRPYKGGLRPKTVSKVDYRGPLAEFMPYVIKL